MFSFKKRLRQLEERVKILEVFCEEFLVGKTRAIRSEEELSATAREEELEKQAIEALQSSQILNEWVNGKEGEYGGI